MATNEAQAPAKINLTLHVTGQRDDGYHLLDSLVVFAAVFDRLWLTAGPSMRLEIDGPFSAGVPEDSRNLVWRAARAAGWSGSIRLEKNLPHGAGIGGGSADAAALLRTLFGDDVNSGIGLQGALELGADVPVCLHAGAQRMQGIGERLTRVAGVPKLDIVLVNPGVHLPTPDVFRALDQRDNPPMPEMNDIRSVGALLTWLGRQRNDLEATAIELAPEIGAVLAALSDAGLARMSGSGSACFGIYPGPMEAARAARHIQAANPGWWVVATESIGLADYNAST